MPSEYPGPALLQHFSDSQVIMLSLYEILGDEQRKQRDGVVAILRQELNRRIYTKQTTLWGNKSV